MLRAMPEKPWSERFIDSFVHHLGLLLLTAIGMTLLLGALVLTGVEVTSTTASLVTLGVYLVVLTFDDVGRPLRRR